MNGSSANINTSNIEKISSFKVDHRKLLPGLYVSRVDGDITTYDLRHRKPNDGDYLDNLTMHSVEHMFATYVRNSVIYDKIIYFGPMGCQTGFYLLVRNADNNEVKDIIIDTLRKIIAHDGEMFGQSEVECGNYKNLSLDAAKRECERYLNVLLSTEIDFQHK